MKKLLIAVITISSIFGQIPSVMAEDVSEEENSFPMITNVEVTDNIIYCSTDDGEMIYDLDNETITFDDTVVYLTTSIDYISDDTTMSEEELLEYDKGMRQIARWDIQ